jgi:hypothetical protein
LVGASYANLPKLNLKPVSDGYTLTEGIEVYSVRYDVGRSSYSAGQENSSTHCTAQWQLTPAGYNTFCTFYLTLADCALPFTIDIPFDTPEPSECLAHFIPNSVRLISKNGDTYIVQAELEIFQPRRTVIDYAYTVIAHTIDQATVDELNYLINNQLPGLPP